MQKRSLSLPNRIVTRGAFSLEKTLSCGQIFRVFREGDLHYVPLRNSILKILQDGKTVYFDYSGAQVLGKDLKKFLGLDHPVDKIEEQLLQKEPRLAPIISFSKGLRIVNLPPYETVISFIFSIQNSIPVITRKLNLLSEMAGKRVELDGKKFYLFPEAQDLRRLSNSEFARLRIGFREKFLREFLERFTEEDLEKMRDLTFEEKYSVLTSIKGVGEKVAHCIMLFSFSELSAFPVDVWIARAMEKLFGMKGTAKKITCNARKLFGEYAGYAQEYIYYYIRNT